MFTSFWKCFKKTRVPVPVAITEVFDFPEYEKYQGFMFICSDGVRTDLELDQFLNGSLNNHFQQLYTQKKIFFADPSRPSFDPKYKIYPDLASLIRTRTSKSDLHISENGAAIFCFNEPIESIYAKIEAGKFHEAIAKAVNYRDPQIRKFTHQLYRPKKGITRLSI